MADDANKDFENLRRDIDELKKSMQGLMSDVSELASHTKDDVAASASRKTREFAERVSAAGAEVRERGEQATESAQNLVREHPLQSVLIAFGVGYLAARLMSRQ